MANDILNIRGDGPIDPRSLKGVDGILAVASSCFVAEDSVTVCVAEGKVEAVRAKIKELGLRCE